MNHVSNQRNRINGVMVSVLSSSAADPGGSSPGQVKPMTKKLVFDASPLNMAL